MRQLRLLPVLAVLLPLLAQAQAPVAASSTEVPPPPLVPAPTGESVSPSPFNPDPPARLLPPPESAGDRVGRMLLETLGGGLGGVMGLGAGFFIGGNIATESSCGLDCTEGALLTLSVVGVGMTLGASAGVFGAGSLMDGQGRFLHTLGGAALAEGAALGLVALGLDSTPATLSILLAPLVGALVGYEVSHVLSRSDMEQSASAHSGVSLMPVVGATPGGGMLGLHGRF